MKKTRIYLYAVILALLMAACGKNDATIDIAGLSEELLEGVPFSDELNRADEKTVARLYSIDNAVSQEVYVGSGATAEEIAIFRFESEGEADAALRAVQQRVAGQRESFRSYVPKEVQRLDNAVLKKWGCYVILCVSEGTEAEAIINQYLQ